MKQNDFDSRYTDVENTEDDIVIGAGEMAIQLSKIKKAMGSGSTNYITPEQLAQSQQDQDILYWMGAV